MFTNARTCFASPFERLTLMGARLIEGGEGAGGDGQGEQPDGGTGGEGASSYKAPETQADLDRIIETRLARERKNYEGHDDYKTKAQQWDALEQSKKTPDEKAIEDAKTAATSEVTQKFLTRLTHGEAKSIARDLGFIDPDDALRVIDPANLPVKDDEPDADAIRKLVEKLAADKPHLVNSAPRKPAGRPQPPKGEKTEPPAGGKGKAAAALRQLGAARRGA